MKVLIQTTKHSYEIEIDCDDLKVIAETLGNKNTAFLYTSEKAINIKHIVSIEKVD